MPHREPASNRKKAAERAAGATHIGRCERATIRGERMHLGNAPGLAAIHH
jgi:hypothetical protein